MDNTPTGALGERAAVTPVAKAIGLLDHAKLTAVLKETFDEKTPDPPATLGMGSREAQRAPKRLAYSWATREVARAKLPIKGRNGCPALGAVARQKRIELRLH